MALWVRFFSFNKQAFCLYEVQCYDRGNKRKDHHDCPVVFCSVCLALVLLSRRKGEERKWLIALIIRNISHFHLCIKESNHPFSPFSTFSTLSKFSLLLSVSPSPASHINYNMII